MIDVGVRILVVDDNEDNRYTLTGRLQREGANLPFCGRSNSVATWG
jgi:CheY-like chemotaxis protein